MVKLDLKSKAPPWLKAVISRRRMRTHAEWKVLTHMMRARPPTSSSTRSRISAAALLVKVIARIEPGCTLRSEINQAIRRVSTRVLPDPAPATTRSGAPSWTTARRCGSLRPASSSSLVGRWRFGADSCAGAASGRPGIGNCMLMSPQPYVAGGTARSRSAGGGTSDRAHGAPVLVQGAVGLHEPDDHPDEGQQDPEAGDALDGLPSTARLLHGANLRGGEEGHHEADEDGEEQRDDAAEAATGVPLHVLVDLVVPVQAVEPERDDEQQDARAGRAHRADVARVTAVRGRDAVRRGRRGGRRGGRGHLR